MGYLSGLFGPGFPGVSLRRGATRRGAVGIALLAGVTAVAGFDRADAADKYAAEFMKIGVGARALGMGGAFVALANDATAAYWNPAGLVRMEQAELSFMHAEQFGDLANHDYFGFAQPLTGDTRSAVGVSLIRFGVDGILETAGHFVDANGDGEYQPGEQILTDDFRTGSDAEYGLLLSYAREMSGRLSLGGNLKMLRQGLLDNTSFGFGVDLGALYDLNGGLTVGARLADATTTRISWDTGTKESVAPSLVLGLNWTRNVPGLSGRVTAGADFNRPMDGREEAAQAAGGDFQGGMEYWYNDAVAARVGADAGNLTAGAGLRYRGFGVDYAYLENADLDATHRVSASARF